MTDRRRFLSLIGSALPLLATGFLPARAAARIAGHRGKHPEPRPGIDAAHVLPAEQVAPELRGLYDRVRRIPQIVDGIGCKCGCGELPEIYSLLSCYEESGMAQHCMICQGIGRLAAKLHEEGRSLQEIRDAVDRRF